MSCFSRYPARFRDESSLLQQKPDPQCFLFDKTPVICERPSDPMAICDKILALGNFLLHPTPHHPEVVPFGRMLQQKPDPQFFFFDKTLVICVRPSDPKTIRDKALALAVFLFPAPSIPKSPRSAGCCNKSLVRSFSLVSISFGRSRLYARSSPHYLLFAKPTMRVLSCRPLM